MSARSPRSPDAVVEVVRGLAPVVEEYAASSERDYRLHPEIVRALIEAQLFRLWLPAHLDGDALPLPDALRVFEAAARLDGSTGWAVMIGSGGGLFAAYLEPSAAAEIFGPPEAVIAGSGRPSGTAREEDGGYVVDGRWSYASGAAYATWFTASCLVPAGAASEPATVRAMAFPRAEVEIIESWTASGMRATGSHDFVVHGVRVPARFSFDLARPLAVTTLERYPFDALSELSFAAVALGVAGHAIEAFPGVAARRPAGLDATLASQPLVRAAFAEALATLESARAFFFDVAQSSWNEAAANGALDGASRGRARLAAVHAVRSAARAVDLLYAWAGTSPLLQGSAFGRTWRDVHALAQHAAVSVAGYEQAGAALIEGGPGETGEGG